MSSSPTIADWQGAWPGCRPISHELRYCAHDQWVRFHSLPASKRYADSESEYAELLARHRSVLLELARDARAALFVVTYSWSDSEVAVPRSEALDFLMPGTSWASSVVDENDPEPYWVHLFLSTCNLDELRMNQLLRLCADDELGGLIIFDRTLTWLYAPYDGGADVILPSPAHRDRLRDEHVDWLSAHPLGL